MRFGFFAGALTFAVAAVAFCNASSSVLDVVMLPHSHDDVGWEKTIDGYYNDQVQYIYDTVVTSLYADSTKRFQSVEMAFFWMWVIRTRDAGNVDLLRKAYTVIKRKQLRFVVGGWTMPDESDIHYEAATNGMSVGHEFIVDTFGEEFLPNFSFEVDPFGATRWMGQMFATAGYDAHIISRVDYAQKADWQALKQLEFEWKTSATVGDERSSIFTHLMDKYSYCNPGSYNFDGKPPDAPVNDYNIKFLSDFLVQNIKERAAWFRTPVLLWPYGCDFQWTNATVMFENMDKIIAYINEKPSQYGMKIRYGHLDDYFDAIRTYNETYHAYDWDFQPYDDSRLSYWTGYFTSRPVLKGAIRKRAVMLRNAEQLHVMSRLKGASSASDFAGILDLRRAQGDGTHHDAVSGTSTTPVCDMYETYLNKGEAAVGPVTEKGGALLAGVLGMDLKKVKKIATKSVKPNEKNDGSSSDGSLSTDPAVLRGIPVGVTVPVVIYNSLAWAYNRIVTLEVPLGAKIRVHSSNPDASDGKGSKADATSALLPCQTNVNVTGSDLFVRVSLPALGHVTIYVERLADNTGAAAAAAATACPEGTISRTTSPMTLSGSHLEVVFGVEGRTETLTRFGDGQQNITEPMVQDILAYDSWDNPGTGQTSGAYVFSPRGPAKTVQPGRVNVTYVTGPLVSEARQEFTDIYSQVIRVYNDPDHDPEVGSFLEVIASLGPLPGNKEVVSRFTTKIPTDSTFMTDSNGMMLLDRKLNMSLPQPIAGNYFPMVTHSIMQGGGTRFTLLCDRAHGTTLIAPGAMEVMMHRHTLQSDGKGPVLDDDKRVYGVPLWLFPSATSSDKNGWLFRRLSYLLNNPPAVLYSKASAKQWPNSAKDSSTGLSSPFPANIHLLTLQVRVPTNATTEKITLSPDGTLRDVSKATHGAIKYSPGEPQTTPVTAILRVVHVYGPGEDPSLSHPAKIDLATYFSPLFTIESIEERTLTGAWDTSRYSSRPKWNNDGKIQKRYGGFGEPAFSPAPAVSPVKGTAFTIAPLEIRTFKVSLMSPQAETEEEILGSVIRTDRQASSPSSRVHVRSKVKIE